MNCDLGLFNEFYGTQQDKKTKDLDYEPPSSNSGIEDKWFIPIYRCRKTHRVGRKTHHVVHKTQRVGHNTQRVGCKTQRVGRKTQSHKFY